MSRYTGPRARVSRRLGTNIWGTNGENIAMEKRPYPPGEHGRTRRRGNVSEYLLQLQEKQKALRLGMTGSSSQPYEEANRRRASPARPAARAAPDKRVPPRGRPPARRPASS